jgi:4-aminobutyrate aminotransferase
MACAAARATLDVLRTTDVPAQAAAQGMEWQRLLTALASLDGVVAVRGQGLLWGIELRDAHGKPDGARAFEIVCRMLQRGVLLLGDGSGHEVLACMPPVCLQGAPRGAAVEALEDCLRATEPGA